MGQQNFKIETEQTYAMSRAIDVFIVPAVLPLIHFRGSGPVCVYARKMTAISDVDIITNGHWIAAAASQRRY